MEGLMEVSLLNEEYFSNIKDEWNALLEQSSNNEFFLKWEWVFTWWEVYAKGKELFILLIKDDSGNLVGIAPWYIKKNKIFFLGTGENVCPEYLNIIIKNGYEGSVIKEIFLYLDKCAKWSILFLSDILEGHRMIDLLDKQAKNNRLVFLRQRIKTPCVYIALPDTWDNMFKGLSAKFRRNINLGRKKLIGVPQTRIDFIYNGEPPSALIEKIFSLHNKRWQEKRSIGKFQFQDYKLFHSKLIERIPQNRAISIFEVNGKPEGMIYGFSYHNKIYAYQSGFNPDSQYKKYSILQIIHSYTIEKAIKEKFIEFDFLRGGEDYKYRWTNLERFKENIFIFNNTWQGKFLYFYYNIKENLINLAKTLILKGTK